MKLLDDFLPFHMVISRKSKLPTPWFTHSISELIVLKNKAKWIADQLEIIMKNAYFGGEMDWIVVMDCGKFHMT